MSKIYYLSSFTAIIHLSFFNFHLPSFPHHPSPFILHPSSFTLHPSTFILYHKFFSIIEGVGVWRCWRSSCFFLNVKHYNRQASTNWICAWEPRSVSWNVPGKCVKFGLPQFKLNLPYKVYQSYMHYETLLRPKQREYCQNVPDFSNFD